jgi:hypothetical protein
LIFCVIFEVSLSPSQKQAENGSSEFVIFERRIVIFGPRLSPWKDHVGRDDSRFVTALNWVFRHATIRRFAVTLRAFPNSESK